MCFVKPVHVSQDIIERRLAGGTLYEARELCTGGELFDEVAEMGDMLTAGMLPQALRWFAQAASGVSHAHSAGAFHGQLRPEHVLLAYEKPGESAALHASAGEASVRLVGFQTAMWREYKYGSLESVGCVVAAPSPQSSVDETSTDVSAHVASVDVSEGEAPTPTGAPPPPSASRPLALHRKTWAHDAPELANLKSAMSDALAAADVWSLGVLLTCMVAGRPPTCTSTPTSGSAGGGATADAPPPSDASPTIHDSSGAMTVYLPAGMTGAPAPVLDLVRAMLDPLAPNRPSAAAIKARADALAMPPPQRLPTGMGQSCSVGQGQLALSRTSGPRTEVQRTTMQVWPPLQSN